MPGKNEVTLEEMQVRLEATAQQRNIAQDTVAVLNGKLATITAAFVALKKKHEELKSLLDSYEKESSL